MKKLVFAVALVGLFALTATADAGPIRKVLRGGKNVAGKVLHRAAHPFGGCKGGRCGK